MMGLTHLQAQMFDAIKARIAGGVGPSYAELQADLGLSSKEGVVRLVRALHERGRITWVPNRARSIALSAPFITEELRLRACTDAALLAEVARRGL